MTAKNRRMVFHLNLTGQAERYFIAFEFVVLMLTMLYLLYVIFKTINGAVASLSSIQQAQLAPLFDRMTFALLVRVTILFVCAFFASFLLGLFFLHRLTGPLVRIRAVLTQLSHGTVPNEDVILRKGDFPTDVAKALSGALKKLRQSRK